MNFQGRLRDQSRRNGHTVNLETSEDAEIELEARSARRVGAGNTQGDGARVSGHQGATLAARGVAALLALCVVAGLPLAQAIAQQQETVILISMDGVRHDYPERAETPALDRLASSGARASRLVPVFPSNTFPSHASLATGTYPDRHGIVNNRFHDRKRGEFSYSDDASWLEAEPLWIAAERQGLKAAVFYWVGSGSAWRERDASYVRRPYDRETKVDEKVDQLVAWLDLPETERPQLLMSYWRGADHAGHESGPDSRSVRNALEAQDRGLARLLEEIDQRGLWRSITVLVVSDHGMTQATRGIDVRAVLKAEALRANLISGGGMAFVELDEPGRRPDALRVLNALDGVEAFATEDLPDELRTHHPERSGDIVLVAEPPYSFRRGGWRRRLGRVFGRGRGTHGYRPSHEHMGAIFYATGRGVPAGLELGAVRSIDIAATVAKLLSMEPPLDSEGRPIPGVGD